MQDNQELVIQLDGQMTVRTKPEEYAVANRDAIVSSLLGAPNFRCPLTATSDLIHLDPRLYVVTKMTEFDLTTEWEVRESESGLYETPVFQSSNASTRVSRPYTPPIPAVMITSITNADLRGSSSVDRVSSSYLFGMSSLPPAPEHTEDIRRFHVFPFANTSNNGLLCTGQTVKCGDIFQLAVEHTRQWNENNWQGDLWVGEPLKQDRCDRIVRYDVESHCQMGAEELGLTDEELLANIPSVAPVLPPEVLDAAWEVGHARLT